MKKLIALAIAGGLLTGCTFTIGTPGRGLAFQGTDHKGGTLVIVTQDKAIIGRYYIPIK